MQLYYSNPSGSDGLRTEDGKTTNKGTKKGEVKMSSRLYVNAGRDGGRRKRWWGGGGETRTRKGQNIYRSWRIGGEMKVKRKLEEEKREGKMKGWKQCSYWRAKREEWSKKTWNEN